mgnify:CR=1 FL=1
MPTHESKVLEATVPVQLPGCSLPPPSSLGLGLLLLCLGLSRADMFRVLICMPHQVMQATLGFILHNKLKQTVIDHFAYKVKHGSMN